METQTKAFKGSMSMVIVSVLMFGPVVNAGSWSYAPVAGTGAAVDPATGQPTVLYGNAQPGVNQYHPTLYVPPAVSVATPSPTPNTQNQMMLQMAGAMLPAVLGMMGKKNTPATGTSTPPSTATQTPAASTPAAAANEPAPANAGTTVLASRAPNPSADSRTPGASRDVTSTPASGTPMAGSCGSDSGFGPPLDNPRVTSCFGSSRARYRRGGVHAGLDMNPTAGIRRTRGGQVKAVADGKIRRVVNAGGRTNFTIIMDHKQCPKAMGSARNCVSAYRHLDRSPLPSTGSCVSKGTGMANISPNSGYAPHLHIDIAIGGVAHNPATFAEIVPTAGKCSRNARTLQAYGDIRSTGGGRTPTSGRR